MSIWNDLGRDVTDLLVIKSLFYLGSGATAVDAAQALLQADRDLYKGEHLSTLIYWLATVKRFIDPATLPTVTTDVAASGSGMPESFALEQNYPNPFNPTTQVQFALASASRIQLRVYTVLGQEVALGEGSPQDHIPCGRIEWQEPLLDPACTSPAHRDAGCRGEPLLPQKMVLLR
jgi:hypothetical protein